MTIVVVTPYGRNETTAAALRVAENAACAGHTVRVAACGLREINVHPFWDKYVVSSRGNKLCRAVRNATHVVHFVADVRNADDVRLASPLARNIFVPPWHTLRPCDRDMAVYSDWVICSTKRCAQSLKQVLFRHVSSPLPVLSYLGWDSGMPPDTRQGNSDQVRVLVYCDYSAIDMCATTTLHVVAQSLARLPRLHITVMSTKSWRRQDRAIMRRLANRYPTRLCFERAGNLLEQAQSFQKHDWFFFAGVRADFGMALMRALSCGCAGIAYDVLPLNGIIADKINGVLIPCASRNVAFDAQVAVPNLVNTVSCCVSAFQSPLTYQNLRSSQWYAETHRDAFDAAWHRLWCS